MNSQLTALLNQAFKRTGRQGWIVSAITIGLGMFMTSLFWLDPEVSTYSLAMKILFIGVVLFFYVVGGFMLYVTLAKTPANHQKLLQDLQATPSPLQKAYHYRVVNKVANTGSPNPVGSQHYVRFEYKNGKMVQLSFPYSEIAPVLEEIYKLAPHLRIS